MQGNPNINIVVQDEDGNLVGPVESVDWNNYIRGGIDTVDLLVENGSVALTSPKM